jgi:predicted nucleic acid-binding Zn ribbon protein
MDRIFVRRAVLNVWPGYGWAEIDANGRGKWVAEPSGRIRKEATSQSRGDFRPGLYLVCHAPLLLASPEPGLEKAAPNGSDSNGTRRKIGPFEEIDLDREAPALFRTFAGLPSKPPALRNFAASWGLLGLGRDTRLIPLPAIEGVHVAPHGIIKSVRCEGESAQEWVAAIAELRDAVALWEAIRDKDEAAAKVRLKRLRRRLLPAGWRQSSRTAAEAVLAGVINARLEGAVSPQLQLQQPATTDRENDALEMGSGLGWKIYYEPQKLLQTLWFQFACAVVKDVRHRQCKVCSEWFVIAPGVGREEKQYCSDACRMRAYRKRKKETR